MEARLLLLILFIPLFFSGCGMDCKTSNMSHRCSFKPSDAQLSDMQVGITKLKSLFSPLWKKMNNDHHDIEYYQWPEGNGNYTISGNFEGRRVKLSSHYFSKKFPNDICNSYLDYYKNKLEYRREDITSCGIRQYSDGKPIYIISYVSNKDKFRTWVSVAIKDGPFYIKESKTYIWQSKVELDIYIAFKKDAKKCFKSESNYNDYCKKSYWTLSE